MKRLLILVLALLLLAGCAAAPTRERDYDDKDDHQSLRPVETAVETRAPMPEVTVTFTVHDNGQEEYAEAVGTSEEGAVLWRYGTASTPVAMVSCYGEVGLWEDRFYLVADGSLVALNLYDGTVLWENTEFGGSISSGCKVIGQDGTVYLAGFLGPDFFACDAQGSTLKRVETIDPDYFWACGLTVEDGVATVYMSGGPEGDMGKENAVPLTVMLP